MGTERLKFKKLTYILQWANMEQQTIADKQVPLLNGGVIGSTGSNTDPVTAYANVETPRTVPDVVIPDSPIASEVIGTSINSETKSILASYNFQSLGGITIGQITISSEGILGVDALDGGINFYLDPDTGSAYFRGTVVAGTIVTGYLEVGNAAYDINQNSITISGAKITTNTLPATAIVAGQLIVGTNVTLTKAYVDSLGITALGEVPTAQIDILTLKGTTTPDAPVANAGVLYIDQSGGKDRLMVRFNSGASQQIAVQP